MAKKDRKTPKAKNPGSKNHQLTPEAFRDIVVQHLCVGRAPSSIAKELGCSDHRIYELRALPEVAKQMEEAKALRLEIWQDKANKFTEDSMSTWMELCGIFRDDLLRIAKRIAKNPDQMIVTKEETVVVAVRESLIWDAIEDGTSKKVSKEAMDKAMEMIVVDGMDGMTIKHVIQEIETKTTKERYDLPVIMKAYETLYKHFFREQKRAAAEQEED